MHLNFNDIHSFLGCSNLNWLEQVFKEQVYPKISENIDSIEYPISLKGTHKDFYCIIDPIDSAKNQWDLVMLYGENQLKDEVEQFKVFIHLTKENSEFKATMKSAFLRGTIFSIKSVPDSVIKVFKA